MSNPTDQMWADVLDAAYLEYGKCEGVCFGQALMQGLYNTYPDIYHQLSNTDADCFYDPQRAKLLKKAFYDIVEGGHNA